LVEGIGVEVVQTVAQTIAHMNAYADHLKRSSHGIWYYRWVVPSSVRLRFPKLPRELKRSTKTADMRRRQGLRRWKSISTILLGASRKSVGW